MKVALCALLLLAACDRDKPPPMPREPQPPRRIIEPPTTGIVRPLPPHAIRTDGVGPYKIGDKVAALLQQLPSGPRIMRFEIPGIVRTSVIRAEEDDTVVIGGETASVVTFVGVVDGKVGSIEKSDVHVGSTRDELTRAIGSDIEDPDRARDGNLVIPKQARNLRVLFDGDRITAIVVTADATTERALPESSCTRPEAPADKKQFAACLTAAGEIVEVGDDELTVRPASGEGKSLTVRIPNLEFVRPLRNLEGRDELIAITTTEEAGERRWSIVGYRVEGTRLVRALESEVIYEMSNARTRWIGAELRDVHLDLELTSQADGIEVGGLLTTHSGDKIRDVAVISPRLVARKSGRGVSDASGNAMGSAAARSDAGSANP